MDIENDNEFIIQVEQFKNGLTSCATGGVYNNKEYTQMRKKILDDHSTKNFVPKFIKSCRSLDDFLSFIKTEFPTYKERRIYLKTELDPLIEVLEDSISKENLIMNTDSYEIGERIGYGGYGEVFKYHHKLIDMDFAIKILNPVFVPEEEKAEFNQRFFREAKILFKLDHPNIVRVYDTGIIGGRPFIRMEYIEGTNIDGFMKIASKVSYRRSLKPIIALLEGLSYAHKNGIIHRDLKPSNFMVTPDGKFKIIDFGISAYTESELYTKLTRTGDHVAGGHYSDPELMINPKLKDVRSDIYSVGAMWYYLLTGRAPVGSSVNKNLIETFDISKLEADIIIRCLSQDINNRYSTCDELLERINPPEASSDQRHASNSQNLITEVTRMDMFDYFYELFQNQIEQYEYNNLQYNNSPEKVFHYYGRKTEVEFLNRLYKLATMPSNDNRVDSYEDEIIQHTVSNNDWQEYWVFDDERLGLKSGNDETLLKFLCEMFHPLVRSKTSDWQSVLHAVNVLLNVDGYEIYESEQISNKSVYSYRVII